MADPEQPPVPQDPEQELLQALRRALSGSPPHVADQLAGMSWAGLEAIEHAEYLLFPDKLYRTTRGGKVDGVNVMLRIPRGHELRKARVVARQMCQEDGVDPEQDADLFNDCVTVCTLQLAVRNTTEPYEPLYGTPRELERLYDRSVLSACYAKLDALVALTDPRPEQLDTGAVLALVAAIAKERSIRPLAVYGPAAQRSYLITTAELLASSLGLRSLSAPSVRSIAEPLSSETSSE